MLINQLIRFQAVTFGDAPMLTEKGTELNFSQGYNRIMQMAGLLQQLGIRPNERIAVMGENSSDHILLLFAAAQIGAVLVPLNYRLAVDELEYILRDAGTSLLLTTDSDSLHKARSLAQRIEGQRIFANFDSDAESWQLAVNTAEPLADENRGTNQDVVLQLYTSGTTGRPKGVMLSHRNLVSLAFMYSVGVLTKAGTGSRDLVLGPLFHIGGMGTATNALLLGGGVVLHRAFDPVAVADALEQESITAVFLVPVMIQAVLHNVPDIRQRDFSKLKRITYGAAPISETLLREALEVFGCEFVQYFGQTETGGGVLSLAWPDHQKALSERPELLRSCGRVMAGVEVKVVDPEGNEVPVRATGEFVARSDTNMVSYWKLPEATASTLQDGWIHTGDAGYIDEEGYAFLRDRLKDMVVTGGENVYPVEVENVLSAHPSVLEVAVIGVPDEKYGEALLAAVVPKQGADITLDQLIDFARERIAGYKIPRQIKLMDALPRNASGKILKTVLREPYWAGRDRGIG